MARVTRSGQEPGSRRGLRSERKCRLSVSGRCGIVRLERPSGTAGRLGRGNRRSRLVVPGTRAQGPAVAVKELNRTVRRGGGCRSDGWTSPDRRCPLALQRRRRVGADHLRRRGLVGRRPTRPSPRSGWSRCSSPAPAHFSVAPASPPSGRGRWPPHRGTPPCRPRGTGPARPAPSGRMRARTRYSLVLHAAPGHVDVRTSAPVVVALQRERGVSTLTLLVPTRCPGRTRC